MEINLASAQSLLQQIEKENIEDKSLQATLEKAVMALQVQAPNASVALPPDMEGAVQALVAQRADMPTPKAEKMNIPGAQDLMASMEKLIMLFAQMSLQNRELNRESTYESLMTRVQQLNQAASERKAGAESLRNSGGAALAMSILGGDWVFWGADWGPSSLFPARPCSQIWCSISRPARRGRPSFLAGPAVWPVAKVPPRTS